SGYEEYKHLALFATGLERPTNWSSPAQPMDFFHFKGTIEAILERLGIVKYNVQPTQDATFSEGIAFCLGDRELVRFGMVKKSITKALDIKQPVFYADFKWDNVLHVVSAKIKFAEISKFPIVKRDLALLIDEQVSFAQIYQVVKMVDKNTITDVTLFDVYQGDKLPQGKKSYAISLKLQDANKTLTDAQIEKIMSKVQDSLEKEVAASLR